MHRNVAVWLVMMLLGQSLALGADFDSAVRRLVQGSDLRGTTVAVHAIDLETGEVLASMNADEPMMPASNMKLLTTAAALDVLGPDFVFRTELALIEPAPVPASETPAPADKRADALPSLRITGDGDPAFGDPVLLRQHDLDVESLLAAWEEAIAATGHTRFDRLVIDDRVFDTHFSHDEWSRRDLIKGYGAQVAGLNFYENVIDVLPVPTRPGQSAIVEIFPEAPFLETINRCETGKTDYFILDRKLDTNQIIFDGTVRNRRSWPFQVTIHDPPLFFGRVLAHRLSERGITVGAVVRAQSPIDPAAQVTALHVVQTTLPLVLARTNQDSQNMFAEALLKRMGHALTGRPGSWKNGAAAVRAALRERLGPSSAAITIADGSGMSRSNRVTARLLAELLRSLHADPVKGPIYRASLAEGGESGTLQNRLEDITGAVYGKSGYISGVSALSGYLVLPGTGTTRPRTIAFSLLFNGFKPPLSNRSMKRVQNRLVDLIDEQVAEAPVRLGG